MKSNTLKAALATTLFTLALTSAHAGDWTGNVGGVIGKKQLDDKEWTEHDSQDSIGALIDFRKQEWPVSIAADFFGTGEEEKNGDTKSESYTTEAHLGLREIFEIPDCVIKPYIGGGVAFIYNEEKLKTGAATETHEDDGVGSWVGAGGYAALSPNLNLGLDVRYSTADVTVQDEERDAGGLNTGVSLGYHW